MSCFSKKTVNVVGVCLDTADEKVYKKAVEKMVRRPWFSWGKKALAEGGELPLAPGVPAVPSAPGVPAVPSAPVTDVNEVVRETSVSPSRSVKLCLPSLYNCHLSHGIPWLSRGEPAQPSRCRRKGRLPQVSLPASPEPQTDLALRNLVNTPGEVPLQETPT